MLETFATPGSELGEGQGLQPAAPDPDLFGEFEGPHLVLPEGWKVDPRLAPDAGVRDCQERRGNEAYGAGEQRRRKCRHIREEAASNDAEARRLGVGPASL